MTQRIEQADADSVGLGSVPVGRGPQKRDVERVKLWNRETRELLRLDPVEQVDQRREGQSRLRVTRPCHEDTRASLPGRLHSALPERRLADTGASDQHDAALQRIGLQERDKTRELRLASDDL